MNVLFVSHSLLMSGGANRSMVQLMLELRKNHEVSPIVLAPFGKLKENDYGLIEECLKHDIPVERSIIPWFIHNKVWLHRFKYVLSFFYYPILISILKKYDIRLIHSNGSVFDLGARISQSLNVPHVWHLREFGTENDTFKPVWGTDYVQRAYSKADVFIAISNAIKSSYKGVIKEEKIVRIYNGIDVNMYKKGSVHNNSRVEFVVVGVVTPHKNQIDAVKAVAELKERGVTNFHLNIIGAENESYGKEIRDFAEKHEISKYITFWGLRNDVPDLIFQMDVGLMLSKSEAFGRVTVEYMFQNLAVVASDTGANPELIDNGKTGFLYHQSNLHELVAIMEKLINDRHLLLQIAKQGQEHATNTFSSFANAESVYQVYKKLLR